MGYKDLKLEYLMKNKEIQELVQNKMKNNMMDLDKWRINNLKQILFELKQLEKNPTYVLSYPKYIIDQWEFDNPLIVKLLEYAEDIERMQSLRK